VTEGLFYSLEVTTYLLQRFTALSDLIFDCYAGLYGYNDREFILQVSSSSCFIIRVSGSSCFILQGSGSSCFILQVSGSSCFILQVSSSSCFILKVFGSLVFSSLSSLTNTIFTAADLSSDDTPPDIPA